MKYNIFFRKVLSLSLSAMIFTSNVATDVLADMVGTMDTTSVIEMAGYDYYDGECDDATVRVTAATGAFKEAVGVTMTPVSAADEKYAEVENRVLASANSEGTDLVGFVAYDIKLVDVDGNEVEPTDSVTVSISYKHALTPGGEDVSDANVSLIHLVEDDNGNISSVEKFSDSDENSTIVTTTENAVESVKTEVDSFSTFAVSWTRAAEGSEQFLVGWSYSEDGKTGRDKWNCYTYLSDDNNYDGNNVKIENNFSEINMAQNNMFRPFAGSQKVKKIDGTDEEYNVTYFTMNGVSYKLKEVVYNDEAAKEFLMQRIVGSNGFEWKREYESLSSGRKVCGNSRNIYFYYEKADIVINAKTYDNATGELITLPKDISNIYLSDGIQYWFNDNANEINYFEEENKRYILNHVSIDRGGSVENIDFIVANKNENDLVVRAASKYNKDYPAQWNEYASGIKLYYDVVDFNIKLTPCDLKGNELTIKNFPNSKLLEVGKPLNCLKDEKLQNFVSEGSEYTLKKVTVIRDDGAEVEIADIEIRLKDNKYECWITESTGYAHSISFERYTEGLKLYYDIKTQLSGATLVDYNIKINDRVEENKKKFSFTLCGDRDQDMPWNVCHYGMVYQGLGSSTFADTFMLSEQMSQSVKYFPADYRSNASSYDYIDAYYDNVAIEFSQDENGYYCIDSKTNKYTYNPKNNVIESEPVSYAANNGFWPLGDGNNHFGMIVPIDFAINSDGKTNGEDTVFEFCGDDDVYVYIDGKLVLDLGGIHDAVSGSINFATGEVKIWGSPEAKASNPIYNFTDTDDTNDDVLGTTNMYTGILHQSISKFSKTYHKMTVVYFERGANQSGCKIKYNFVPVNTVDTTSVEFTKVDSSSDGKALEGAEFTLTGKDNSENEVTQVAISDENGKVQFLGLKVGNYTIRETAVASALYSVPAGAQWNLTVYEDSNGDIKSRLVAVNDLAQSISVTDSGENVIKIINYISATKQITVKKYWENATSETLPEKITFYLYASYTDGDVTKYIGSDGDVSLDPATYYRQDYITKPSNDVNAIWSKTISNLPVYYNGDSTKIINWTVKEKPVAGYETGLINNIFGTPIMVAVTRKAPSSSGKTQEQATGYKYSHVDIKTNAAVDSASSIENRKVVEIKDFAVSVIGYYDGNNYQNYHDDKTIQEFKTNYSNQYEWSVNGDGARFDDDSIISFGVRFSDSEEGKYTRIVIDKDSKYPSGTVVYSTVEGYEKICKFLGTTKSASPEYVDISGCKIFDISLLVCQAISINDVTTGTIKIRTNEYGQWRQDLGYSGIYYYPGLDLVLSPNTMAALDGTGDEIFEITNTKINIIDEEIPFSEIDKTSTADGRDAIVDLSVLEGVKKVTYSEVKKPSNLILVVDTSKSMLFPSDLVDSKIKSMEQLDKQKGAKFYVVGKSASATVYRVWYRNSDSKWVYCDASLSEEEGEKTNLSFNYENGNDDIEKEPILYKWTSNKTRKDYLIESAENLVDTLPAGSNVSIVIFNKQSKVYNFKSNKFEDAYTSTVTRTDNKVVTAIDNKDLLENKNANELSKYVISIDANDSKQKIRNAINFETKDFDSCTRQDAGLATAKDLVSNYYYDNKKADDKDTYVVLFSDGCPNIVSNNYVYNVNGKYYNALEDAKTYASAIKSFDNDSNYSPANYGNCKIFTVGIDFTLNSKMQSAEQLMAACASEASEGTLYNYSAKSQELNNVVNILSRSISSGSVTYQYKTGDVVDVIDERFNLVVYDNENNEIVITNTQSSITQNTVDGKIEVGGRLAILSLTEKGLLKITWKDQELGQTNSGRTSVNPWTVSFRLRAKDDFIGGNMIMTNDPESGVEIPEEEDKKFPKPSVNVERYNFKLADDEEILFLGETITDVYDLKTALNAILATAYDDEKTDFDLSQLLKVDVDELDEQFSPSLLNGGKAIFEKPYIYGNTNDIVGTLKYELTQESALPYATEVTDENGTHYEASKLGAYVNKYTLKVTYVPLTVEKRKTTDGTAPKRDKEIKDPGYGGVNPGEEQTEITATGNYYVTIISADLGINKYGMTYTEGEKPELLNGAEFGLYVNGVEKARRTSGYNLKMNQNGYIGFDELFFGTNEIRELSAPRGYALSNTIYSVLVEADKSNTKNTGKYKISVSASSDKNALNSNGPIVVNKADYSQLKPSGENAEEKSVNAIVDTLSFDVYNYVLYKLPHTGGSGIYVFTIGGMLLMLLAVLLLYREKNKKTI